MDPHFLPLYIHTGLCYTFVEKTMGGIGLPGKWKVFSAGSGSRSTENFEYNTRLCAKLGSGLLNGQGCEPLCAVRYGKYDMKHCGCEIIAVYNAMKLLHMPQELAQLICEFEENRLTLFLRSALFGSDPKKLRRFFDAHGAGYEYYTDRQHFCDNASRSPFGIVGFWVNTYSKHPFNRFSSGLHTVAYTLDKNSGKVSVYNRYGGDTQPRVYKDMQDFIDDRRFICGYLFPNG